jgi:hypothetical protein
MRDRRLVYSVLVGIPDRLILGRPRCIWEDNTKMDFEVGWGSMNWI